MKAKNSSSSHIEFRRPLSKIISLRLAVILSIVTILASVASYFYFMTTTEELVKDQLMKFSHERGLRESALFLDSEAYQVRFHEEYVERYKRMGDKPFVDLYFSSLEKTSVSRWPGTPWGLMMDDKVEWRDEEWMAITMSPIIFNQIYSIRTVESGLCFSKGSLG